MASGNVAGTPATSTSHPNRTWSHRDRLAPLEAVAAFGLAAALAFEAAAVGGWVGGGGERGRFSSAGARCSSEAW